MDKTICDCGNEIIYFSNSGFVTCMKCKKRLVVPISEPEEVIEELEVTEQEVE